MVIHQMGSVLGYGDAITNHIATLDRQLVEWGFSARLYAASVEGARIARAELDTAYTASDNPDDILIYHYSAYCDNYQLFRRSRNRKILIYHNITPSHFYQPFDPYLEAICREGREVLPLLRECDLAFGVSEFNRQELIDLGFDARRTRVMPILPSLNNFATTPRDRRMFNRLKTPGITNILFVGRVAPNKAHDDLLTTFAAYHRHINRASRLILAGPRFLPRYNEFLDRLIIKLNLQRSALFTDRISLAELKACYEAADVFMCASRHEGFCVPLLEAMSFGLPILARAETAIPDTLGSAGVLFHDLDQPILAETLQVMVEDADLRRRLIDAQRRRLADFAPEHITRQLRDMLISVGVSHTLA